MKKSVFIVICLASALATHAQNLLCEIEEEITGNVLPYWMEHVPDGRGGFHGAIAADGTPMADAPRGGVLAGRLVWTFSAAYRAYGRQAYREMADMMQRYYITHMIDAEHGGVYWTVGTDGKPLDDTKQAYATAFGVYALSEHFRATGDSTSLNTAIALYRTLKNKMHDNANGGYYEAMSRDFSRLAATGVDGRDDAAKTMNTHIHLLEALTGLCRVWQHPQAIEDMRELIHILSNELYDPQTGHLVIFCDEQWRPVVHVESYGHDIETSWLLTEAAQVLGEEALLESARRQAVAMTDAALRDGLSPDGALFYERSPMGLNTRLAWWVQSEAVVGCLNAWQITGEQRYYDQSLRSWQIIKERFVDRERGEWFHNTTTDGTPLADEPKVSLWNCPYHNSRMLFETRRMTGY